MWLDVNIERKRVIKNYAVIQSMQSSATDIYKHSWIDDYYPSRPDQLSDMNLFDFRRWHDHQSKMTINNKNIFHKLKNNMGIIIKKTKPFLINHYHFNPEKQPEQYCHAMLLLFKPWRKLTDLLGECDTYKDAFMKVKDN